MSLPWRQRPELDPDDEPSLPAPARLEHHTQDAVDAEPVVPEAGVGHCGCFALMSSVFIPTQSECAWTTLAVSTTVQFVAIDRSFTTVRSAGRVHPLEL